MRSETIITAIYREEISPGWAFCALFEAKIYEYGKEIWQMFGWRNMADRVHKQGEHIATFHMLVGKISIFTATYVGMVVYNESDILWVDCTTEAVLPMQQCMKNNHTHNVDGYHNMDSSF